MEWLLQIFFRARMSDREMSKNEKTLSKISKQRGKIYLYFIQQNSTLDECIGLIKLPTIGNL